MTLLHKMAIAAALAVIATVAACAKPALADGVHTRCTHSQFYGTNCTTMYVPDPAPPTAEEIAEHAARAKRWDEFCKPTPGEPDAYGMVRLQYAHKGCEFGRDR